MVQWHEASLAGRSKPDMKPPKIQMKRHCAGLLFNIRTAISWQYDEKKHETENPVLVLQGLSETWEKMNHTVLLCAEVHMSDGKIMEEKKR